MPRRARPHHAFLTSGVADEGGDTSPFRLSFLLLEAIGLGFDASAFGISINQSNRKGAARPGKRARAVCVCTTAADTRYVVSGGSHANVQTSETGRLPSCFGTAGCGLRGRQKTSISCLPSSRLLDRLPFCTIDWEKKAAAAGAALPPFIRGKIDADVVSEHPPRQTNDSFFFFFFRSSCFWLSI